MNKRAKIYRQWMEQLIADLVLDNPDNLLEDYQGQPIFGRPLIGVADGDDPMFQEFRSVVDSRHLHPREVMGRYADSGADLAQIRVVSWVLPFSREIRQSNRGSDWPSRLYSLGRNNGGAFNFQVRRRLTETLRSHGFEAISPALVQEYDAFRSQPTTFSSTWSERHVAFAAGLGWFGLNGSLITPLGCHVRLGSLLTNLPVETDGGRKKDFRAPCYRDGGQECGLCQKRCPARAIAGDGLDKVRCYSRRNEIREKYLDRFREELHLLMAPIVKSGTRTNGFSLGCALCQCGVPCEGSDPFGCSE
jgi:epoxyqueuosine reductase